MTSEGNGHRMAPTGSEDAERWQLVQARARPPDRPFVYAVRTTGVVCRPGCASRLPRRENVEFFATVDAARAAGYRPCRRCRPDAAEPADVSRALVEACRLLAAEEAVQTRQVAAALGWSTGHLQRFFKAHLGVTPQQYRRRVLAERARTGLAEADSVTESVYRAGYSSSSRFYAGVGRELGMRPATAHAGAAGELIHYSVAPCSLGQMLIAWTDRGVCQVDFADSVEALLDRLARRLPGARLERETPGEWATAIVRAVERPEPVELPLDIRGTAFQERVWRMLTTIPQGQTRSYAEVARAIGQPSAARAVAAACAANPLAVVVPCHRVVRADGDSAGYRWGVERKREILRREAAAAGPARPGTATR
jgi:AraC family transcriptional regulator of adaptative response/methylated-DNA-[protein]-cysteine methyltransferase